VTTTRTEIISRLLALPLEMAEAEDALIRARASLAEAKDILEGQEGALILDPETITGRNVEARAAQVREYTTAARQAVTYRQADVWEAELSLHRLQNEMSALRSVARLLAASDA
jgi:hypothetical protein